MIRFLLQRPIAVLMAFTAFFIMGLATYFTLPVSLLPDIAIPEITVQVTGANRSARELENTVVKTIRQQLMQVAGLRDIHSETRDGAAIVRLSFDYGTDTDLAFIEVNEKIDAAMNYLPRELDRPRVVKASATDIPVFCLNLTLKRGESEAAFLDLCQLAEQVIKRRIEQLPEVAMVDVTGLVGRQVRILPDERKMEMLGLSVADLESALVANNVDPGSMVVRDGYYEYHIRFSSLLRTPEDVEAIYLRQGNRLLQLKDLAKVEVVPERETGLSLTKGKRAVTLAIIKQAEENMERMEEALGEVVAYFRQINPDIDFTITRDQTELLNYTISNLKQNLSLGFLFICVVALLFLGDVKSPVVIGLSMVVSLVTSFLFFYLFHLSLNIISLSGLILALGMMIDSAIIVTENIAQYRARGMGIAEACDRGTSEVITPMLSSTFTTIAVFVPLVFLSGIAGAIFYDQAFAVTVGLLTSYLTGILLLPVLYQWIYSLPDLRWRALSNRFHNPIQAHTLDRFYDAGVDWVFAHPKGCLCGVAVTLPLCALLFYMIPKSRMPEIDQRELLVRVEWNEPIHVEENRDRVLALFAEADRLGALHTAYIGQQQFLLNRDRELAVSEAELYFKTARPDEVAPLQAAVEQWLRTHYPQAVFTFAPPETVFEKLFEIGEADVVAEFYARNKQQAPEANRLQAFAQTLEERTGLSPTGVAFEGQLNLSIDHTRLLLYRVDEAELYRTLRTAFKENEVATLRSYQQYLPIHLSGEERTVEEILSRTLVRTLPDEAGQSRQVPLRALVKVVPGEDLKTLTAGKQGEYIPFSFYGVRDAETLMRQVREVVNASAAQEWEVDFSGSLFANRQMLNELVVILFLSILLMYFILAAQFESFKQPLIVLVEIPIDVAAALLVLWLCGHSLNLMSAIGIVVTCGIIINDSILKIDVINTLRQGGTPMMEAIHEAGRRRLRPIIMTSLTTIFGMVPLLFSFDMGSELQKPLAIAMISAMLIGTLVSLFIIPLVYKHGS